MQKAIIIQKNTDEGPFDLDASELNAYLEQGWRVIHLAPFGCAVAVGGDNSARLQNSAALVIIEKGDERSGESKTWG